MKFKRRIHARQRLRLCGLTQTPMTLQSNHRNHSDRGGKSPLDRRVQELRWLTQNSGLPLQKTSWYALVEPTLLVTVTETLVQ